MTHHFGKSTKMIIMCGFEFIPIIFFTPTNPFFCHCYYTYDSSHPVISLEIMIIIMWSFVNIITHVILLVKYILIRDSTWKREIIARVWYTLETVFKIVFSKSIKPHETSSTTIYDWSLIILYRHHFYCPYAYEINFFLYLLTLE